MHTYHIQCDYPHEDGIPDYYPLTVSEVIDLLTTAREIWSNHESRPNDAVQEASSIQKRLGQGIPGMVCPHEIDGPVADRHAALDQAYINWLEDPDTLFFKDTPIAVNDAIVVTLMSLMC